MKKAIMPLILIILILGFLLTTHCIKADTIGLIGINGNAMNSTCTYQYQKDPTYRNNAMTLGGDVELYKSLYSNQDYIGIKAETTSYNDLDGQGYNLTTLPIYLEMRHYISNTGLFCEVGIGYNLILNQTTDYDTQSGITWNAGLGYDVGNFELGVNYVDNVFYYQKFTAPHQLNFGSGSYRTAGVQTTLGYKF